MLWPVFKYLGRLHVLNIHKRSIRILCEPKLFCEVKLVGNQRFLEINFDVASLGHVSHSDDCFTFNLANMVVTVITCDRAVVCESYVNLLILNLLYSIHVHSNSGQI
jgi:hypothetical protein